MTTTTNLKLNKPNADDFYSIDVQNENMDIIDAKVAEQEQKLDTAKGTVDNHIASKNNPHGVTKAQVGLGNVNNTADSEKSVKYATSALKDANGNNISETYAPTNTVSEHTENKNNPHGVTKSQVGLSNVPNVGTNDQTPTYTVASSNTDLASGEKLSIAFGKIAKAINSLISHLSNTSNPHSVTKSQVGLGNVPNLATNDQAPTYTVASSNTALVSGEKMNVAFGKIAKAVNSLIYHLADTVGHITSAERTAWNNKLDATAKAVNSDKLDGLDSLSFPLCSDGYGYNTFQTNNLNQWLRNGIYGVQQECTPLPSGVDGWGSIVVLNSVGGRVTQLAWFWNETGQSLWRRITNDGGAEWTEWVRIADAGNTALVKIQSTAPTDTKALWIY